MVGSKKGFVLCVVGPSGVGKTSLCDRLAKDLAFADRSISVTTRPQRLGEVSGSDYIFVNRAEFQKYQENDELLEWAEVFGNFYGTPVGPVRESLSGGRVIIMDIDTVGAHYVSKRLSPDVLRVFILPPSMEELKKRLRDRKQNNAEDLERRLKEAKREIEESEAYEHRIVNDDLERAYQRLKELTLERFQKS